MRTIDNTGRPATFSVALVVSRFNKEITQALLDGALAKLKEKNFRESQVTVIWVPGAVEIPIAAKRAALSGGFDTIIALGAVIRGETSHYDYVCLQVSQGCQQVALEHNVPVIFGVLTTENEEQAKARAGGDHGNKGADAVEAACETVSVLRQIT